MERLQDFFASEGIECFGCVPYSDRFVSRERYLAQRYDGARRTLCAFAVPYYVRDDERNISVYAVPKDYHLYFDGLFVRLYEYFSRVCGGSVRAFSDTSPFNERALAQACGIGSVGDNGLLINPVYGSYVFLGSIITDLDLAPYTSTFAGQRRCTHCGACGAACPSGGECLSRITQTKGALDAEHAAMIKESGCAWGCDVCQSVCPANIAPRDSHIPFFREGRIPYLTSTLLESMSDREFAERAYAWKGRECILRNVKLLEES